MIRVLLATLLILTPASEGGLLQAQAPREGATPAPGLGSPPRPLRPQGASQPATERERSTMTEIYFDEGDSSLSEEARTRIDQLLVAAHRRGQIEQVKILAWGDAPYPGKGERAHSRDRKLADVRAEKVVAYIRSTASELDVKQYNMAERPSTLQRALGASQARIKRMMEEAEIAGPEAGRGSRAIIMVTVR
jgi:hypothetical protein